MKWRRMGKGKWKLLITNEEVLMIVNEVNAVFLLQRKNRWIGHVLRNDVRLHEVSEGRIRGKPTRGRRRIQMLHRFANDSSYVALKWARRGHTEK